MKDFQRLVKLFRTKTSKAGILIFPSVLVLLLSILAMLDIMQKGRNFLLLTREPSVNSYAVSEIPILKNKYDPLISAKASVVMDKDTYSMLYQLNPHLRFSPASTTKIMTSLVALDYYKLDDILEVKKEFTEGSVLGLTQGQKFTFESLLYAMMLHSANDAAYIIAQNYPGGVTQFVDKMNQKSKELALSNTQFEDPAGLIDEKNYTTAVELARLSAIALDNEVFAKVVSTPQRYISDEVGYSYYLLNKNKLLGIEGVNGIKTGFTEEAGDVLVTSKKSDSHTIIIVVLKSLDRFGDTYELLSLVNSSNLTYLSIHP